MINILYYLFLSHFLADYLFQPGSLADYKQRSFFGVVIHGMIVGLVAMALLIPYLYSPDVWYGLLAIVLTHIVIDHAKIQAGKRNPSLDPRALYVLDQLLHYGIIVMVGVWAMQDVQPQPLPASIAAWYGNPWFLSYLLALILVTYFYDITRHRFSRHADQLPYRRDYYGMLMRAVVATFVFMFGWILTK